MSITDKISTTAIVRNGYNKIAHRYLKEREKLKTNKWIERFVELLPNDASILDLGCGAGVPVDNILVENGCLVLGVDISSVQIALARRMCPGANYIVSDLMDYDYAREEFDGVVCLFVMFHIPRNKQLKELKRITSCLKKGGYILISMGERDFEGNHMMLGEVMWASQYSTQKNIEIVRQSGLVVVEDAVIQNGGEAHQMILARKL